MPRPHCNPLNALGSSAAYALSSSAALFGVAWASPDTNCDHVSVHHVSVPTVLVHKRRAPTQGSFGQVGARIGSRGSFASTDSGHGVPLRRNNRPPSPS